MKTKDLLSEFYSRKKDTFTKKLEDGSYIEIIEQMNGKLYAVHFENDCSTVRNTMTVATAAKLL